MDIVWGSMFNDTVKLATDVYDKEEQGFDVSELTGQLSSDLAVFPEQATEAMARVSTRIKFPTTDVPANELILLDKTLVRAASDHDTILNSLITFSTIADKLGLDAAVEIEYLNEYLPESAANRSVFLQMALDEVVMLRSVVATLPDDEELTAQLAVAEARIKWASQMLQDGLDLMQRIDLDNRGYRQQIVTATGELTTDVLDVGVFAGLIRQWTAKLWGLLRDDGPRLFFKVLVFFLIVFAFSWLGRLVRRGVEKAMQSSRISMSSLLRRMVIATSGNLITLFGILVALSQIGVSLGPLLAGLGIAGFIVGFALQDTLSNFASGVLILIYRPFDVGDFVEAGGVSGQVKHLSLVNTTFMTFDNQKRIVPNNLIWQQVITNVTAQHTRRVDLEVGVSYDEDLDRVESVLREMLTEHEEVLKSPEPMVEVHQLGDSAITFIVRPWVRTDDYWPVYWKLTKAIKQRLDREGIVIPYPQRVVHSAAAGSKSGN
jgi:small conductance mechanosensitive channel